MNDITLGHIKTWTNGRLLHGSAEQAIQGVSTDTRTLMPGELFVAIVGERFDGHDFLDHSSIRQAAAIVVDTRDHSVPEGIPTIEVADTTRALQDMAAHYRARFDVPCVAVTGSNGKTTTKDLIAHLLRQNRAVHATKGNFNNHIGVPLTLFELTDRHEMLVVELGMNHLGEIDRLAQLVKPDIGVITNVGPVHLEFLETVDNVYRAKLELAPHVATLLVNGDDPQLVEQARELAPTVRTFGLSADCDVRATEVHLNGTPRSVFEINGHQFEVPLPGRHNVYNALAAIAVGRALDVSWETMHAALKTAEVSHLRSEVLQLTHLTILNDTYNANPVSMAASLKMLQEYQTRGRRVAILGDMFELGERANELHVQLGQQLVNYDLDWVIAVGAHADDIANGAIGAGFDRDCIRAAQTMDAATEWAQQDVQQGDLVLIKGSRGMTMEQIVRTLETEG